MATRIKDKPADPVTSPGGSIFVDRAILAGWHDPMGASHDKCPFVFWNPGTKQYLVCKDAFHVVEGESREDRLDRIDEAITNAVEKKVNVYVKPRKRRVVRRAPSPVSKPVHVSATPLGDVTERECRKCGAGFKSSSAKDLCVLCERAKKAAVSAPKPTTGRETRPCRLCGHAMVKKDGRGRWPVTCVPCGGKGARA